MSNQQKPESNACDQCFRRKQSCSKSQPECQRCHDTGSSCTYSFGKFMGKPKKSLKTRRQRQQATIEPAIHHSLQVIKKDGHSQTQRNSEFHEQLVGHVIPSAISGNVPLPSSVSQPQGQQDESLNSPNIQNDSGLWPWPSLTTHTGGIHPPTRSDAAEPENNQASSRKRGNSNPACDQCYRFKVKCTKEPGRCQRCVNSGSVCTYSSITDLESPPKRRRLISYSENRTSDNEILIPPARIVAQKSLDDLVDFNTSIPPPTPPNSALLESRYIPTDSVGSILGSPTMMIDPSLYLPADYSSWTTPHDQSNNWQDFSLPESDHHDFVVGATHDPNLEEQNSKGKGPCTCLSSALSVLAKLQECLNFGDHSSFDKMLSAARSGFRVCEQSSRCNHCSRSVMLMLCIVILQQVGKCYDNLAVNKAAMMPSMSLKLGSMEFHGFSSPDIMSTILGIEKKQGAAVCLGLDKLTRPAVECRAEAVWGGDHLSGLLGVFRQRFNATV